MCRFRSSDPCLQAMHRWGVSCGSKRPHWNSAAKQLEGAARFCAELARQDPSVASLDVDACLSRMEDPAQPQNFFCGWVQDYRTLAQVQHQRHFSFIPEGSINTPQEFTAALQTYAKANGMQLSLTKEGMYRNFRWMGSYTKPTATRASTAMRSAVMLHLRNS